MYLEDPEHVLPARPLLQGTELVRRRTRRESRSKWPIVWGDRWPSSACGGRVPDSRTGPDSQFLARLPAVRSAARRLPDSPCDPEPVPASPERQRQLTASAIAPTRARGGASNRTSAYDSTLCDEQHWQHAKAMMSRALGRSLGTAARYRAARRRTASWRCWRMGALLVPHESWQPGLRAGERRRPPALPAKNACRRRRRGPRSGPPDAAVRRPPPALQVTGAWATAGHRAPWPEDEYVRDGGDDGSPVMVSHRIGQVYRLGMEDTVAHFDTTDGRTMIEASNKVTFTPLLRRRAHRHAVGRQRTAQPVVGRRHARCAWCVTTKRQDRSRSLQAHAGRSAGGPESGRRLSARGRGTALLAQHRSSQHSRMPSCRTRTSRFCARASSPTTKRPRLAAAVQAAITWTADQAVQVMIDNTGVRKPSPEIGRAQATFTVDDCSYPKLRMIKVASTQTAAAANRSISRCASTTSAPRSLGNIVVLDSLSPRLEYVPDWPQSSLEASLQRRAERGNSLVLRWEIDKPIQPGDGGVVRFRCVVR